MHPLLLTYTPNEITIIFECMGKYHLALNEEKEMRCAIEHYWHLFNVRINLKKKLWKRSYKFIKLKRSSLFLNLNLKDLAKKRMYNTMCYWLWGLWNGTKMTETVYCVSTFWCIAENKWVKIKIYSLTLNSEVLAPMTFFT